MNGHKKCPLLRTRILVMFIILQHATDQAHGFRFSLKCEAGTFPQSGTDKNMLKRLRVGRWVTYTTVGFFALLLRGQCKKPEANGIAEAIQQLAKNAFMRMTKPGSSTKKGSFVLKLMTIVLCLISCNNSDRKADLEYGTSLFRQKCMACHGRFDGLFENAPGLITLQNCDSLTLVRRLWKIKGDNIHKDRVEPYNAKEVNSIYQYIRVYFEPRYWPLVNYLEKLVRAVSIKTLDHLHFPP